MSMRQLKYIKLNNFIDFLKINENNILLFVHINNLNKSENSFIEIFTKKNDIKVYQIYSNLIKKIAKNDNFSNLLSGPTKIYAIKSFSSLLEYSKENFIQQKIVPLTIF